MAGMALSASPSNFLTRIEPHLFRVVLLRRLRLPLPLSVHTCRDRLLDSLGHHRAVPEQGCWGDGDLQSRVLLLDCAAKEAPTVEDPQAAWLLLLMCASTRANNWLRRVQPEWTSTFAETHDAHVWESPTDSRFSEVTASLPFFQGGGWG